MGQGLGLGLGPGLDNKLPKLLPPLSFIYSTYGSIFLFKDRMFLKNNFCKAFFTLFFVESTILNPSQRICETASDWIEAWCEATQLYTPPALQSPRAREQTKEKDKDIHLLLRNKYSRDCQKGIFGSDRSQPKGVEMPV